VEIPSCCLTSDAARNGASITKLAGRLAAMIGFAGPVLLSQIDLDGDLMEILPGFSSWMLFTVFCNDAKQVADHLVECVMAVLPFAVNRLIFLPVTIHLVAPCDFDPTIA